MKNDNEEPSAASAGSVAGEPDAWMHVSGGLSLGVFKHVDPRLRHLCVPLYRHSQPMLTAAEREAVEQAIDAANGMGQAEPWTMRTLRGLLERMK